MKKWLLICGLGTAAILVIALVLNFAGGASYDGTPAENNLMSLPRLPVNFSHFVMQEMAVTPVITR